MFQTPTDGYLTISNVFPQSAPHLVQLLNADYLISVIIILMSVILS